jgi:hypothetical protein
VISVCRLRLNFALRAFLNVQPVVAPFGFKHPDQDVTKHGLDQWFPNFFGPPPPWFQIHTHSAPLPFFKKHKCAFVSTFILYLKIV